MATNETPEERTKRIALSPCNCYSCARRKKQKVEEPIKYRAKMKQMKRLYNKRHPQKKTENAWRKTGKKFTVAQRQELLQKQDFKCAICRTLEADLPKKLHLDHCHATGKIRGLLCARCNLGLGHFLDNKGLLQKAIDYLEFV